VGIDPTTTKNLSFNASAKSLATGLIQQQSIKKVGSGSGDPGDSDYWARKEIASSTSLYHTTCASHLKQRLAKKTPEIQPASRKHTNAKSLYRTSSRSVML